MKKHLLFIVLLLSELHSGYGQAPAWTWVKSFEGYFMEWANDVSISSSGEIISTGASNWIADFNPGPDSFNISNQWDIAFITKLDASGNFIWAKAFEGNSHVEGYALALDGNENIYSTGLMTGAIDFDPGPGVYNLQSFGTDYNCFISRLDSSGNFIWARVFDETHGSALGVDIAVNASGQVYVLGHYNSTVDFNQDSTISYTLSSVGHSRDIFIAKFSSSGNIIWVKSIGGPELDNAYHFHLDSQSNIYLTGAFRDTADLDPDSSGVFNLISSGSYDIFILKLDSSGNFSWAKSIGGYSSEYGYGITMDEATEDVFYITGGFHGEVDFDPDSLSEYYLNANSGGNMFISKFDTLGKWRWAKSIGGPLSDVVANDIDVIGRHLMATGYFYQVADFDPDTLQSVDLTAVGNSDAFVLELDTAGSLIWAKSFGGSLYDRSNANVADGAGRVIVSGTFESPVCIFDTFSLTNAISGSSSLDFFIAKLDGVTGIEMFKDNSGFIVFPNPARNTFIIRSGDDVTFIMDGFEVYDVWGRLKDCRYLKRGEYIIDSANWCPGIYFVRIFSAGSLSTIKVIIE